jgi:hypothetical protein
MKRYQQGTLLTRTHGDCGCRLRVSRVQCPDAGKPYRCTCSTEMVAVEHEATARSERRAISAGRPGGATAGTARPAAATRESVISEMIDNVGHRG